MNRRNVFVGIAVLLFLLVVLGSILSSQWPSGTLHSTDSNSLSSTIFNDYGLAVLVVGLVLFVSMLGGVYLAQEEKK